MHPSLLLLTDSRLPAGGHAHSGGIERAVASGAVHDVPSLASFLHGRLHTAGTLAAALTAAACMEATRLGAPHAQAPHLTPHPTPAPSPPPGPAHLSAPRRRDVVRGGPARLDGAQPAEATAVPHPWLVLDAEVDARTASPAQRDASRTQGRLLLRVARRVWPSPVLDDLVTITPSPHHPVALGAAARAAGATPEEAALAAAYHAVTGPATAAVRLLGLDPVAVHALLADLTPGLTVAAAAAAAQACPSTTTATATATAASGWETLPAHSSPALDLLAEQHAQAKVRLFIS